MARSVLLIALGGTISMQAAETGGIAPKLSGSDLMSMVPGLEDICEVEAVSPFRVPSGSLDFGHIHAVADLAKAGLTQGHCGVVVVQGTDTIEETAFLLDLLVDTDRPVVVTGAMRGADAVGADGPANILSAVRCAACEEMVGLGATVVFNDEIHASRHVRKADTGMLNAFSSAPYGPIGRVSEGDVQLRFRPAARARKWQLASGEVAPVAIVQIGFGDDGRMLRALPQAGFAAAVVTGFGAGHLPEGLTGHIDDLVAQMPVVLATRVVAGPVFEKTYGYPGSEMDLIKRGVIPSGELGPAKARLLLQIVLAAGCDTAEIAEVFAAQK